jgi:hypothetical protein
MPNIVWTVLPNGVSGQSLKLSIFVSLRVDSGTLSSSFSQNWTQLIANLSSLQLLFNDGGSDVAATFTIDKSLLTPHLWTGVFPPSSTQVTARAPQDLTKRPLVSYSVSKLRSEVEAFYKPLAESEGTAPPLSSEGPEGNPTSVSSFVLLHGEAILAHEGGHHPPVRDIDPQDSVFYHALRFYRRDLNGPPTGPVIRLAALPAGTTPTTPQPDFHQAIGMLGDHPDLLRRLGLIIDGTVPKSAVTTATLAKVRLKAPTAAQLPLPSSFAQSTPWTRYTRESGLFLPEPSEDSAVTTDLRLGMLKLGDSSRFEIQQLDTDGSALKLGNYAVALAPILFDDPPDRPEPPHLRTAGLMVARVDRSTQATQRFGAAHALEGNVGSDMTGTVLQADDVLRGFRVDARRQSDGQWRSLCQREGSFLVGASQERVPAQGLIHDEGYIKASGASSHADMDTTDPENPLYVHEALFEWQGWSPIIPPPGRSLVFDNNHAMTGTPAETTQQVDNVPPSTANIKVQPQFKVEPGTLPKLRYGETYNLRMRAVDLAGNSLPLATTVNDATTISPAIVYRRYEPVPSPVLVLRRPVVEGETVEHIVIRSKVGNVNLPGNLFFSSNDRHVAPPGASLDAIITHGKLDPFFNDPTRSFNIALKSDGTFLDRQIVDIRTGNKINVPGIQIINTAEVPPGSPTFPVNPGDGLLPGQYVIHADDKLLLPYLPDPFAPGVALNDVPAVPNAPPPGASPNPPVGLHKLNFQGDWPQPEPFKLIVTSTTSSTPSVVVQGGNLVVRLPPATILPLRFSSLVRKEDLPSMAIWDLISSDKQATLLQAAQDGQHWMLTPWRQLLAIHAVNRPLVAAKFNTLAVSPDRKLGETFAILSGVVNNHSHSTGQLDIQAVWSDRVDRVTDPAPTDEPHNGKVASYRPNYDDSLFTLPSDLNFEHDQRPKHDFGDSKHRYVNYRPDATTRYRENFPTTVADDPNNILVPGLSTQVNIFSSARPDKPNVLYIVPTFNWLTQNHGQTSKRVGRGLRVYLARPWFSSGVDELLGVLIPQDPTIDAASDPAEGFISEWGSDPVWDGTGPTTNLTASAFLNHKPLPAGPLSIKEKPTKVGVVPFDVTFDANRKVWFADIEMTDVASYFPFVRLAFARYQPFAITDANLSPVVRADFVQLVNDRSATIVPGHGVLQVTVSGIAGRNRLGADIVSAMFPPPSPAPVGPPGFQFDPNAGAGRIVAVRVERRDHGGGDLDWTQIGSEVVLPSFSPTTAGSNAGTLWSGSVPRPPRDPHNPYDGGNSDFRLVIREIEVFDTDTDTAETLSITLPMGHASVRGRVAYLDTLSLSDPSKW